MPVQDHLRDKEAGRVEITQPSMHKTARDSNNNLEEGVQDISDWVPKKKEPMDYEVNVPDTADDDHGYACDTNNTEDNGNDSCMDTRSDEEWVRDYERFSGDIVWKG